MSEIIDADVGAGGSSLPPRTFPTTENQTENLTTTELSSVDSIENRSNSGGPPPTARAVRCASDGCTLKGRPSECPDCPASCLPEPRGLSAHLLPPAAAPAVRVCSIHGRACGAHEHGSGCEGCPRPGDGACLCELKATHGKNGVAELPAVVDSGLVVFRCWRCGVEWEKHQGTFVSPDPLLGTLYTYCRETGCVSFRGPIPRSPQTQTILDLEGVMRDLSLSVLRLSERRISLEAINRAAREVAAMEHDEWNGPSGLLARKQVATVVAALLGVLS